MVDENFGTAAKVKASLWPTEVDDVSVDVNKAELMRTDKYYGLNNADNVAKWYAICSSSNNTRIEFQNEIFSYFGISHNDMMNEATNNFCQLVDNTVTLLKSSCPKMGQERCDSSDFAYWQWANSYFTMLPALGLNKQSVSQLDSTILGYPEISYFKPAFVKNLTGSQYEKVFDTINFGTPSSGKSYEHIFYLPNASFVGDLPASSLFNLDTLKAIFLTLESFPDIGSDPTVQVNFSDYKNYTQILQLDDDRQTYLLLAWLKNMLEVTAMRKNDGGSYFTTNVMGLGQVSLSGALGWMSREFPAYLYGNIMALSNASPCETNIRNYIRDVEDEQVPRFCNDTKLNLVSAESYSYYASIYFTRDYEKIQYIYDTTGLSEQAMAGLLTHDYYLERNLIAAMKKVKKVYNSTICSRSVGLYCSNRELAYAQWYNETVSSMPPKPLNVSSNLVDLTGARHYKPEIKNFYDIHNETMPNMTLSQVWDLLSSGTLWNQLFVGDVLLDKNSTKSDILNNLNTPIFKKYFKMLIIEEGLGGLFVEKTVKEYIEGYNDKILLEASQQQLEQGGDPTIVPWMSINDNPTNPMNSTDCFFVGDDKHKLTRSYGLWLNNRYIRIQGTQIKGLRNYQSGLYNPWAEDVAVQGTDGGQFNPLLSQDEQPYLFISDIMMPARLKFKSEESLNGMTVWKYEANPEILMNSTENENNKKFYNGIHGTLNLTTVLQAPIFATKGHGLDISYNQHYLSKLLDKTGKEIVPKRSIDDVYMTVEPLTGMSMSAGQRLALNFYLEKDELFENVNQNYLIPYTYVKREFTLNEHQTKETLGDLRFALNFKLGIQITGYTLGFLLIIAGVLLLVWAFKIRNVEGLSDYQLVQDYKPNGSVTEKKNFQVNTSESRANEETKDDNQDQ